MRLFGGFPNIRKMITRAVFALSAIVCAAAATPAAAQVLSVTHSLTPSSVDPGNASTLQITINNANPDAPVTGTTFNLDLRADSTSGLLVLPAGANGGVQSFQCLDASGAAVPGVPADGAGFVTAVAGATSISMAGGTIPQGSSTAVGKCLISIKVTSGKGGPNALTINLGDVHGTDNHGPVANTGTAPTQILTINQFTQPTITKTFHDLSVPLGAATQMTITIKNNSTTGIDLPLNGSSDSPNFGLTDNLGAIGMKVAPTPNASGGCPGGTFSAAPNATSVTAVGGTIAAGATCTLTVDVVGTTVGAKTNTINATSQFNNKRLTPADADATANLTVSSSLVVARHSIPIRSRSISLVSSRSNSKTWGAWILPSPIRSKTSLGASTPSRPRLRGRQARASSSRGRRPPP